jgi:hypothetical protein
LQDDRRKIDLPYSIIEIKSSARAGLLILWQKMGYFLFFSV